MKKHKWGILILNNLLINAFFKLTTHTACIFAYQNFLQQNRQLNNRIFEKFLIGKI